jgi:hypothetical protein
MTHHATKLFNAPAAALVALFAISTIFSGMARADAINLNMEGASTATIPKGNTVTRRIFNIPAGYPGTLNLKLKWHAVHIIPNTFNPLKVVVRHGSTVLKTETCYSVHSTRTPKCSFAINVTADEADDAGNWEMVVTNNSSYEVIGFDLEKGSDINPLVPSFRSIYTPNCPSTVNLDMEGTTLTLGKGNTQERQIFGIGKLPGVLRLKAKWHALSLVPNTFNALKIDVLKPNGQLHSSGSYYSIHSNKSPKFDLAITLSAADAALAGTWKLRITNNGKDEVAGFNIEKEGADLNPLVPSFFSSYKATCTF